MTPHEFLNILVGPSGRYLRGLWEPEEILAQLFWSAEVNLSRASARKIINGQHPFPTKYINPYRAEDGSDLLEEDLEAFLAHYHSCAMLRDIHIRMHHAVVTSNLPIEKINEIEIHYIPKPTTSEMAVYFSCVFWHIAVH